MACLLRCGKRTMMGDQGQFLSRATFERAGGFAEIPLVEDVEMSRALYQAGRLVRVPLHVTTSSRRFLERGPLRQWFLAFTSMIRYLYLGATPEQIAAGYRSSRKDLDEPGRLTGEPQGKKMRQHVIVYAKRPLPGYAKTRLGAAIGAEEAAGVYARLLYGYLLNLVRAGLEETRLELSVAAPEDVPFFGAAFPELAVRPQIAGDLGQRMAASFKQAFQEGAEAVVLTGSDVPALDSRLVCAAFEALAETPAVLGPARDGGYYLIGMRAPGFALFDGVAWSTERVLAQTKALAHSQGLALAFLRELDDVDTGDAFDRWRLSSSYCQETKELPL